MAAPATKNINDLNGKWIINKTHSDATDPVLALQGISWLTRKAVGLATVTLHTKQYTKVPEDNAAAGETVHIDIDQVAVGGIKGTTEQRAFDWTFRPHADWLFGELQGRTRMTTLEAVRKEAKEQAGVNAADGEFLCEGWLEETEGKCVESWADNEGAGWTGWQIWGFALVNGERWLVRKFAIRRKDRDEVVRVRLCYEWAGELDA